MVCAAIGRLARAGPLLAWEERDGVGGLRGDPTKQARRVLGLLGHVPGGQEFQLGNVSKHLHLCTKEKSLRQGRLLSAAGL